MTKAERNTCVLCGEGRFEAANETAKVHSNVRRWVNHVSTVWRCSSCGSLHSLEQLDLTPFYATYPFRHRRLDSWTRKVFNQYVKRLQKVGLTNASRILDYGCSEGLFLDYLGEVGIMQAEGYDAYVDRFSNASVLDREYDFIIAQDVIEHVEQPEDLFRTLISCLRPGGILCVGTPRADAIDLQNTEQAIHSLHQPYHLHILSEAALLDIALKSGLVLEKLYRRHILDTPFPFINWTFLRAYLQKLDNTLDAGFDPPNIRTILASPYLLLMGLAGYLFPVRSELLALFRKPA